MALDKKIRGLTIEVGGSITPLGKAFDDANLKAKNLTTQMSNLQKKLKEQYTVGNLRQAQEAAKKAIEATTLKVDVLRKGLNDLEKGPQDKGTAESIERLKGEIAKAETEAVKAQKSLEKINKVQLDHITKSISNIGASAEALGKKLLPVTAGVTAGFTLAAKAAIDMETAVAGVAKTTDLTDTELSEMRQSLFGMSKEIPVAAVDLAGIAENAGQLGIQKENIIGFTRTMADLGATTNLTGEEAAQTAAKFANVTKMAQSDFDRMGSAIVDLGNNAATTEKDIMNMGMRIAAAGTQAGMTQAQILGIASAASSLGLEAEAGGTAFSRTINAINIAAQTGSEDLAAYAKTAGMTAEQFKEAWESDAAGAFTAFIKGLDSASRSAVVSLEELGFDAERQRDALSRAAISGDLFADSITRASRAWSENVALANEAEKRYETTASKLTILKNEAFELATQVGDVLLPIIQKGVSSGGALITWLNGLDRGQKAAIIQTVAMAAALGPLLTLFGKGATSVSALIGSINAYRVAATGAAHAQAGLNAVAAGFSAVTIVGAIVSIVAVLGMFISAVDGSASEAKRLTAELDKLNSAHKDAVDSINKTAEAHKGELDYVNSLIPRIAELNEKGLRRTKSEQSELNALIESANGIIPNLIGNLNELTGKYNLNETAIYKNIEALKKKYELEANESVIKAQYQIIAETKSKLDEATAEVDRATEAYKEARKALEGVNPNDHLTSGRAYYNDIRIPERELRAAEKALSDYQKTIGDAQSEVDKLVGKTSDLAGELSGLSGTVGDTTKKTDVLAVSAQTASKSLEESRKAAASLSGEVENAAKSYYDVADAQDFTATSAANLYNEYADLIAANPQLIAQHGDLLAVLSSENTMQENAAEITKAVFSIKKQLLIDELTAQQNALDQKVALLKAERDAAIETYKQVGMAAALAYAADKESALKDAMGQAGAVSQMIESLKKSSISSYKVKTTGGSGSSAKAKKEKSQEELDLEAYRTVMAEAAYLRDMSNRDEIESKGMYYAEMERRRDQYLTKDSDEWRKATLELHRWKLEQEMMASDEIKAVGEGLLADIKFEKDLGLMNEAEYYKNLQDIRDVYFADNLEKWRAMTVEINDFMKRQAEAQQKSEEEAVKAREDQHEKLTNARIAQINREIEAEQKRVDKLIDNIDLEIQKRRELREDQDIAEKVERARKQRDAAAANLSFARDDADAEQKRKELARAQEALDKAIQDADDQLFYRSKEAQKDALRSGMEAYRTTAQSRIDDAANWAWAHMPASSGVQSALVDAASAASSLVQRVVNQVTNNTSDNRVLSPNVTLQTGGVSMAQLSLLIRKIIEDMLKI